MSLCPWNVRNIERLASHSIEWERCQSLVSIRKFFFKVVWSTFEKSCQNNEGWYGQIDDQFDLNLDLM